MSLSSPVRDLAGREQGVHQRWALHTWCVWWWADLNIGRRSKVDSASCSMQRTRNRLMVKGERY
jgi:hypothetical protein